MRTTSGLFLVATALASMLVQQAAAAACANSPLVMDATKTDADLVTTLTAWTSGSACDGVIEFEVPDTTYYLGDMVQLLNGQSLTLDASTVTGVALTAAEGKRLFKGPSHPSTSTFIAKGIVLQKGVPKYDSNKSGGCMYFASTVTFTLHNCVLQDCLSPDSNSGGAVYLDRNAVVDIQDTIFQRNSGRYYGAMLITLGTGTIRNSKFLSNFAERDGGALGVAGSAILLENCDFIDNYSQYGGGGAIDINGPPASLNVTGCLFKNNKASRVGGAIWNEYTAINLRVTYSTFEGNQGDFNPWLQPNEPVTDDVHDEEPFFCCSTTAITTPANQCLASNPCPGATSAPTPVPFSENYQRVAQGVVYTPETPSGLTSAVNPNTCYAACTSPVFYAYFNVYPENGATQCTCSPGVGTRLASQSNVYATCANTAVSVKPSLWPRRVVSGKSVTLSVTLKNLEKQTLNDIGLELMLPNTSAKVIKRSMHPNSAYSTVNGSVITWSPDPLKGSRKYKVKLAITAAPGTSLNFGVQTFQNAVLNRPYCDNVVTPITVNVV